MVIALSSLKPGLTPSNIKSWLAPLTLPWMTLSKGCWIWQVHMVYLLLLMLFLQPNLQLLYLRLPPFEEIEDAIIIAHVHNVPFVRNWVILVILRTNAGRNMVGQLLHLHHLPVQLMYFRANLVLLNPHQVHNWYLCLQLSMMPSWSSRPPSSLILVISLLALIKAHHLVLGL